MNGLLENIKIKKLVGTLPQEFAAVCIDSRKVKSDSVFIAINGYENDGHKYISSAIESGASMIVCEELPKTLADNVCYVQVADSAKAAGIVASNFYDNPSSKLKLIGVTGTNGKTTVVTLLYNLFTSLGYCCGMLSTVKNVIDNVSYPSVRTTPDQVSLNELLNEMTKKGCDFCFMEVSSHAAHQRRIAGLTFAGGIFTNITHDHLDYHKTFPQYIAAKKMFFDMLPEDAFAITNVDDKNGLVMTANTRAKVYTYGVRNMADFHAKVLESQMMGTLVQINSKEMWLPLPCTFNVYNQLAVYATAVVSKVENEDVIAEHISNLKGAEGRFQLVPNKAGLSVIVDYAHTPDALENVLKVLKEFDEFQRVICVFGAGGDRDTTKRPEMGAVSVKYADMIIVTSDNPRSEDPDAIIADIMKGIDVVDKRKTLCITDREQAIKAALKMITPTDILLVAGKGHEKYQEIKCVKHHFDDVEIISKELNDNN